MREHWDMSGPGGHQVTKGDIDDVVSKWTGVPLRLVLQRAGIRPEARYVVFHCADPQATGFPYYESIDRVDAGTSLAPHRAVHDDGRRPASVGPPEPRRDEYADLFPEEEAERRRAELKVL